MCKDFSWDFPSTVSINLDCPQPLSVCVCVCVCVCVSTHTLLTQLLVAEGLYTAIADIKPVFFSPGFKALCV